jgi:CO/xanthine dehydrogenase Mo-binding subunit
MVNTTLADRIAAARTENLLISPASLMSSINGIPVIQLTHLASWQTHRTAATLAQSEAAMGLGLAPENVRTNNQYMGGSFGRRFVELADHHSLMAPFGRRLDCRRRACRVRRLFKMNTFDGRGSSIDLSG